jgi:DNA repair protein RecO
MHTILETDCFILKSSPSGEANKQIDLFTEEFGLIRATAQGLRYLKSKLRYSLTDFSYARVSLVRGKEFWRIITAAKKGDIFFEIESAEGKESLYRIFAMLRRLLQGEDSHPQLFKLVYEMFKAVDGHHPHIAAIEELTVLRILFLLGYVKDDVALRSFVETSELDDALIEKSVASRKTIVSEINRALNASNL